MATDHFEDDIELDDEITETDDLDLDVLENEEDVTFDNTDFDIEPADEEEKDEEDEDPGPDLVEGDVTDDDEEEEDLAVEEEDDDEEEEEEEEEDEDEETLEVLLGPDSDTAVTPSRPRSDESGDAPPGEGEFTCRSCFLVKRRAQLADPDALICLDCA